MQSDASPFAIKRIKKLHDDEIHGFNKLLDEGTVWDLEQAAHFLSNDDNALFVAYWGGELAGFLTAYRLQRFDKRKAEVLLYEIGVSEKYQRRSIGSALIHEVKKWASEVGAEEVWVITNKSNRAAMALYTSTDGVTESDDEQMFVYKL